MTAPLANTSTASIPLCEAPVRIGSRGLSRGVPERQRQYDGGRKAASFCETASAVARVCT